MEIKKTRTIKTDYSSIGPVSIDGEFFCYGLEPTDRGLNSLTPLKTIELIKRPGITAVPTGRYKVIRFFSPKHQIWLARVIGIPGFDFVEIHVGDFPKDTEGCLLLGTGFGTDMVSGSKAAIELFYQQFFIAINKGEEVWITYE
jgi:hypothetical protein